MTCQGETILLLRIFVEVDSDEAAAAAVVAVKDRLGENILVRKETTSRYWKIPEYYELFLELVSEEGSVAVFDKIIAVLGGEGWEIHPSERESWAVWNKTSATTELSIASARWASLEMYR